MASVAACMSTPGQRCWRIGVANPDPIQEPKNPTPSTRSPTQNSNSNVFIPQNEHRARARHCLHEAIADSQRYLRGLQLHIRLDPHSTTLKPPRNSSPSPPVLRQGQSRRQVV
ncbi:hypothetical protein E4U21_003276 [Claviceps maximensis]|nr:hypothetical protein E4U21_003276 [Claviceps maximensis]